MTGAGRKPLEIHVHLLWRLLRPSEVIPISWNIMSCQKIQIQVFLHFNSFLFELRFVFLKFWSQNKMTKPMLLRISKKKERKMSKIYVLDYSFYWEQSCYLYEACSEQNCFVAICIGYFKFCTIFAMFLL